MLKEIHDMESRIPSNAFTFLGLLTVISIFILVLSIVLPRRQKYAPGVPIVKKPDESIRAARERFRSSARQMLSEGYRKVVKLFKLPRNIADLF